MKLYCVLCGHAMTSAAVYIGQMPVGTVCARRAGLVALGRLKKGAVTLAAGDRKARAEVPRTADLFPELQP